jgi:hypothetical protein
MTATFESLAAGDAIDGPSFAVSRESVAAVLRRLARRQPAASRRRLHEGQFRQDQFRRHHRGQSIDAGDPSFLCMGLFSIFWLGAASAWRPGL